MNLIKNIIFPPLCFSCRSYLESNKEKANCICKKCKIEIEKNTKPSIYCPKCNEKLKDIKSCCDNFLITSSLSYRNDQIRDIIHNLKYKNLKTSIYCIKPVIRKNINFLIGDHKFNFKDWIIVPTPIHKSKFKQRGFNQSELIAKTFQKLLIEIYKDDFSKVPFIANSVIIKTKRTESQTKMENYNERSENIKNSFQLIDKSLIENKNIILIDDVFTSGATMNEMVKELKKSKVKDVLGFVVTKT